MVRSFGVVSVIPGANVPAEIDLGSLMRLRENTASLAFTGEPSEKRRPGRRWKVYVRASGAIFQDSASSGTKPVPVGLTRRKPRKTVSYAPQRDRLSLIRIGSNVTMSATRAIRNVPPLLG